MKGPDTELKDLLWSTTRIFALHFPELGLIQLVVYVLHSLISAKEADCEDVGVKSYIMEAN